MNHATTAHATKNETTNPISRMSHLSAVISIGGRVSPGSLPFFRTTVFRNSYPVATTIVGIDRKNENSSADLRDIPAICPAAMVDIERDVQGKTAERICHAPIQTACRRFISSM